ncbi:hypothetical protein A2U01_0042463, partial [Trifolium medium]|nr:hypothetical protein [Trifolium medium]
MSSLPLEPNLVTPPPVFAIAEHGGPRFDLPQLRSEGDWNHWMAELTPNQIKRFSDRIP